MKIAITGASGHLGNVLCQQLLKQRHQIKALFYRDQRAIENLDVEQVQGHLLNQDSIETLLKGCDAIIHSAAKISITKDRDGSVYETNVTGTKQLIEASKKAKIKTFIYISSTHVSQAPKHLPLTEDSPYKTEKKHAYAYTKSLAEQLVLQAFSKNTFQGCVLRPSSIVGPYDYKPSAFGQALLDFKKGKIPAIPSGGYDFVDVRDVAKAVSEALTKGQQGEVYHLSGKYHSIREVTKLVQKATGTPPPPLTLPFTLLYLILPFIYLQGYFSKKTPLFTSESLLTLKNGHPNIDHSKAKRDLNLKHRPLLNTIKDFYAWKQEAE